MEKQPKTRRARREKRQKIEKAVAGAKTKDPGGKEFSIPIYDMKGKKVSTFTPDKELFTGEVNKAVLYQAVVMYNFASSAASRSACSAAYAAASASR